MFMGDTQETLVAHGERLLALSDPHVTYRGRPVLDVGCGYGRLAYALAARDFAGPYLGIDVLPRQIAWLRENFSPVRPDYHFERLDITNERYNKLGSLPAAALTLPPNLTPPDLVIALSLFTHMYEADIAAYLRRIAGIMDVGSMLYATFFLRNDEQGSLENEGRSGYPMQHVVNDHCAFFDTADPLRAIAYDEDWMLELLATCGLNCATTVYGSWCGRSDLRSFQDVLFCRVK